MKKKCMNIQFFLLCISLFLIQFAIFTKNIIFVTNYAQNLINIAIGILFINSVYVLLQIRINIKQWIIYFFILLLAITSFIVTDDSLILQLFLTIISSININFKKIIKNDICFKLTLLIFIVLCYYNGHALTHVFVRDGELRYAYGFNQPNAFGYFLLILFFEIVYIKNTNIKLYIVYLIFFIMYYFINSASSRSSQICICLFIIIYTIYYIKQSKQQNNKKSGQNISKITKILFLILTIVSIYLTNEFDKCSPLAIKINDLFSDRLLLQSLFLKEYNFNLIGNNIFYFETLDNVYIRTLLNFGIVASIVYTYIFNKIIKKAISQKENIIVIIIFVFFIYGIMEWYIIRPSINIFLIYFSTSISTSSKIKNKIISNRHTEVNYE